jgi:hypothetical protein
MVFVVVVCASLVAGVAGVVLASRMPKLALTAPATTYGIASPAAVARVYGRRVPTDVRAGELALAETAQFSRPGSQVGAG